MPRNPGKPRITGGVDTHKDTHHAAVVLMNGRRLADAEFPATEAGHAGLLAWMRSFGRLQGAGVEGTGSYGAALARYLHGHAVRVVEVNRPDRRQRRAQGKSDPLDAYAAADAVLAGRATAIPKTADGIIESIRALHLVRSGAVKSRTACVNEMKALVITAPAALREQLPARTAVTLAAACTLLRPSADLADPAQGIRAALASLGSRYAALTTEITTISAQLAVLVRQARPDLLAVRGVGTEIAAQLLITCGDNPGRLHSDAAFASLCGASPVPASSGKTRRHRLNRGGDRQANRALYMIVITRLGHDPATRAYAQRRTTDGLSKKEIIRCLKRYIARKLYKILTAPPSPSQELPAAA